MFIIYDITAYDSLQQNNTSRDDAIIRDTGSVIDNIKDWLTPFYFTKSHNDKNTGLGISLVYGIIIK